MRIKEAWKAIEGELFLCNGIGRLRDFNKITEKQAVYMNWQIDTVRQQICRRFLTDRTVDRIYCVWPCNHPERKRFCRLAARGHARDYKIPQALGESLISYWLNQ